MPRNRSEMPRRAFGSAFAAQRTVPRVASPESNRSKVMVLDALDAGLVAYLSSDKKLSGGFWIFDADDEDGG